MKQRNIRKKRALDEQEELSDGEGPEAGAIVAAGAAAAGEADGEGAQQAAPPPPPRLTAEDIKLLQKQRQRKTGVDVNALAAPDARRERRYAAAAAAAAADAELSGQDGLKAAFKRERRLQAEEEDPHMKKYIEEQLAKRMGRDPAAEEEAAAEAAARAAAEPVDPFLEAMPEGLQKRQQDTELGPSWVTGILEVPLSMEQKLKNIEDTEAAKKQMLASAGVDDDDGGGGAAGAARRGMYPVSFGKQNPKMQQVIAEAHAKKARLRTLQEEKKRKKQEEFAGW